MKAILALAALAAAALITATAADAPPPAPKVDVNAAKELLTKTDCNACHHARNNGVGPSYKLMAKKLGADEAKIAKAKESVIKGYQGPATYEGALAPQSMMTAHPNLTPEQVDLLVRYIIQAGSK